MMAFVRSGLFLRFLSGFLLGTAGVFLLQPERPAVIAPSATAAAPASDRAAP